MNYKFLRLTLIAPLFLAGAAQAQGPMMMPPPRTIAVAGQGEVAVAPDRARLRVGVFQVSPDLAAAQTEVNKVVRAYLVELKALGTKESNISTAGFSIQPEYVWDEKENLQRLTGYRVSRDIEVLVENLDKLGDYLLRATKAGVNQMQPPQLESSKAKDIQQQALVKATQDAQAKAKLLADTLGVKVGPVRTISAGDSYAPAPMPKMAMAMRSDAGGNSEMGLLTGEIRYSASVSAEFDLIP